MSEIEKLRELLREARGVISEDYDRSRPSLCDRIDEALAESVEESDGSACPQCGCANCEAGRAEQEGAS
jgi:hypothetical protein